MILRVGNAVEKAARIHQTITKMIECPAIEMYCFTNENRRVDRDLLIDTLKIPTTCRFRIASRMMCPHLYPVQQLQPQMPQKQMQMHQKQHLAIQMTRMIKVLQYQVTMNHPETKLYTDT